MLSKAIPKAYLRKYQRPMFQIQGVLSSGNGSPPPLSLLLFHRLRTIWTCHEICFSYSLISFL